MSRISSLTNIIILSILITVISYFLIYTPAGQLDASTSYRGLLIPYWSQTHATYDFGTGNFPIFPSKFNIVIFLIDAVIWFAIIEVSWFVIKITIKKLNKNK